MTLNRQSVLVPVFLGSIIAVVGCGQKNSLAPASISGGVTYKGKTVTGGSVQFIAPGGTPYASQIAADGTYAVTDVPTGEMAVVVETESINPAQKEASGKDASRRMAAMDARKGPNGQSSASSAATQVYMKIPEKYSKARTSPLTYTVKSGRQVYNIELD